MLIGASLLLLAVIVIFSLVLGGSFIGNFSEILIDNEAIIDGVSNTFVIPAQTIFYNIDTTTIVGGIIVITGVLIGVATLTGISVVGSGLNPQSARIIILASIYGTVWAILSTVAYGLIVSIEIFGGILYVMITIAYIIGVVQSIAGGD